MPNFIYEYDNFEFTLNIPAYWNTIYKGKPRNRLYHDYCVMLDQVKHVSKDRYILDVGVNNGLFAIPAEMLGYKVLGFEPVSTNFRCVQESRVLNHCDNLTLVNQALSDENGEADIYVPECLDNASFKQEAAIANMKNKAFTVEKVTTVKFDDWITEHPTFSDIGLIKIDVQGFEFHVITGMKEFLKQAKNIYLILEYENHLQLAGHTYEELDELVFSFGFDFMHRISNSANSDKLFYKQA